MTLGLASRASSLAIASGLLVAGCMAGENTASKTDPGTGTDVVAAGSDDGADTGGSGSNAPSLLTVTNLAADQAGQASNLGAGLMNAWGIVSFNGMLWAANEGSGKVSIFDGEGKAAVAMTDKPGMIASDSLDLGEGITGIAVNDMAKPDDKRFQIHMDNGVCQPAQLIFASTKGMLIGVNPDLSTTKGFTLVDRSGSQMGAPLEKAKETSASPSFTARTARWCSRPTSTMASSMCSMPTSRWGRASRSSTRRSPRTSRRST